ncbi:MAG TPA: LLM class flavin-dependent oxidoreductase [Solirubrobacteraceae bacterium]|jgi:alkanesulfonate monooxygenase SsuD/methylene tetrahydromethanopterin reductase-like flavin-dependent oxidoreductase (luciferase family)|nr:LLM class flavin-dependent oxidoreductase [Solirubrobacteraceae bacterium]
MAQTLRVGIKLSQDAPIESYKAIWQIADQARFDHCWAMDHLATIGGIGDDRPIFDGWELLAAMAVATSHVRIGLLVTGITYRNPALLAKIATTVDHLSDGRLEFGIGAAWAANEHEMYGISGLDHRVGLFSEGLQVIRSLWGQERTDFDGRYYKMSNAVANPKPVQKPYPPIWIGSGGPTMIKLTARHADVWNASGSAGSDVESAIAGSRQLDEACAAIGRDPGEIRRSVQVPAGDDPSEIVERVRAFAEAGFTEVIIMLSGGNMPTNADPVNTAAMLAEKVLPELRS